MKKAYFFALVVFIFFFGFSSSLFAATFIVNNTRDSVDSNPGNGTCADRRGSCTLRAAVMESNALSGSDTISLAAGTYSLTLPETGEDGAADGTLNIGDSVTITGADSTSTTINASGISGNNLFWITEDPTTSAITVSMSHVTLTGANDDYGAVLYNNLFNSGTQVNLSSCVITANSSTSAGLLFNNGQGVLNITDCTLSNNTGNKVVVENRYGTLNITRTTFENNQSIVLKGMNGTTTTMTDSIVTQTTGNVLSSILVENGATLTIIGSTFYNNTPSNASGGAIYNKNSTVLITNSTFSGNQAGKGGALYAIGDTATATTTCYNCTIAGNEAATEGGGIFVDTGATITLKNSIVARNRAFYDPYIFGSYGADCCSYGILISAGYNLISDITACSFSTLSSDLTGTYDANLDAGLGSLANNGGFTSTYSLNSSSPALDSADPAGCTDTSGDPLVTDQRGYSRPEYAGGRCDRGAYEYQVTCGDNVIQGTESCEDGNTSDGDGCSSLCILEGSSSICGDGILVASEECDDGNVTSGDGCSSTCTVEVEPVDCNDEDPTISPGAPEIYGDGIDQNCDGVDAFCGNGIVDGTEECDGGTGCSSVCTVEEGSTEVCGDGIVDGSEQCDDGNTTDNDGCSNVCVLEDYSLVTDVGEAEAGDSGDELIIDVGEAATDGNATGDDTSDTGSSDAGNTEESSIGEGGGASGGCQCRLSQSTFQSFPPLAVMLGSLMVILVPLFFVLALRFIPILKNVVSV